MIPQEQDHTPAFELPPTQPVENARDTVPEQHQAPEKTEKQSNIALEQGAVQSTPPPITTHFSDNQPMAGHVPQQSVGGSGLASITGAAGPPIADDADLIEKEWVAIAKDIVAKTAHDPHLQNKEINKFKADYMKKRYNKDIKLSED